MKAFNTIIHAFTAICCLLLILSSCVESTEISINEEEGTQNDEAAYTLSISVETPTNIIFLIGDGMGTSLVSAAYFYGQEDTQPNFSRFPLTLSKNARF